LAFRKKIKVKIQASNKINTNYKRNKKDRKRILFIVQKKWNRKEETKVKILYPCIFIGINIKKAYYKSQQKKYRDYSSFQRIPEPLRLPFDSH
jgi:hypothetical protein